MSPKKINPQKASVVSDLTDLASQAKSIAVIDYTGLKVNQAVDLRRSVKKAGGRFLVTKNTLFSLALEAKGLKLAKDLTGPSAFIFSLEDEVAAIKAVADYARKNSPLPFKQGYLGERVLTGEEISRLATIPDRITSLQLLAGHLNAPIFSLVYSLNWNIANFVRTLDAIRASKAN